MIDTRPVVHLEKLTRDPQDWELVNTRTGQRYVWSVQENRWVLI